MAGAPPTTSPDCLPSRPSDRRQAGLARQPRSSPARWRSGAVPGAAARAPATRAPRALGRLPRRCSQAAAAESRGACSATQCPTPGKSRTSAGTAPPDATAPSKAAAREAGSQTSAAPHWSCTGHLREASWPHVRARHRLWSASSATSAPNLRASAARFPSRSIIACMRLAALRRAACEAAAASRSTPWPKAVLETHRTTARGVTCWATARTGESSGLRRGERPMLISVEQRSHSSGLADRYSSPQGATSTRLSTSSGYCAA
mmetsp:Transcript_11680/g.37356  ORF Transcript_11680/g.37356 Transcript_11680/m.37356 type:complete len:262 (-) Transcript_11680:199-984(-)